MSSRSSGRLAVAVVAMTAGLGAPSFASAGAQGAPSADSVLLNAKVLRYHGHSRWSQAVAVKRGKIVYVGGNRGARRHIGKHTKVLDAGGRMIMPGIVDGHWHGQTYTACNMNYKGGTIDSILSTVKACLIRKDQAALLHTNAVLDVSYFITEDITPAGTQLTRQVLDRLSASPSADRYGTGTTRPIVVSNADFHKFHTNSKAIQNAKLTAGTPDPADGYIGRDAQGVPNGIFSDFSAEWGDAPPPVRDADYLGMRDSVRQSTRYGITTVMQAVASPRDLPLWKRLADSGVLTTNISEALTAGSIRGQKSPRAIDRLIASIGAAKDRFDGYRSSKSPGTLSVDTVKVFCDGVAEYPVQTAAMTEPYNVNQGTAENPSWVPGPSRGPDPSCSDARLGFVKLHKAGWSIHVHAIGDRAVHDALDNFQAAHKARRWDARDTITHLQFIQPGDVPRFAKLGVVASMSLQWAVRNGYTEDAIRGYVNKPFADRQYPANSLRRAGARLAGGSDWPVDVLNPFAQIESAVDRTSDDLAALARYPGPLESDERLSLMDALRMHTLGGAYQLHRDRRTGSIDTGKDADLIVLDRNLLTIPIAQISDAKPLLTMTRGKVVWQSPAAGFASRPRP